MVRGGNACCPKVFWDVPKSYREYVLRAPDLLKGIPIMWTAFTTVRTKARVDMDAKLAHTAVMTQGLPLAGRSGPATDATAFHAAGAG